MEVAFKPELVENMLFKSIMWHSGGRGTVIADTSVGHGGFEDVKKWSKTG